MNKGKERKIKMKKSKMEKGITLIALIITIVVLLILAAVAITAITEYNIIENANSAAQKYGDQANSENTTLGSYNTEIDKYMGGATGGNGSGSGSGTGTVAKILDKDGNNVIGQTVSVNTKAWDEFGNQIVVPAGFKIRVDADAGIKGDANSTATNVTEGIVIEDEAGNQFVWVPVGDINTASGTKTITLGRYAYDTNAGTNDYIPENGEYTPGENITAWGTQCTEELATDSGLGQYGNAIARNIGDFVNSSIQNGGYYIGRFEAGRENDKLVCKAGQIVYADITQPDSSTACKKMYNNGEDGYNANTFSSDLINSYAWDTAIIFIQTFGGENEYYKQNKSTSRTTTGGNQDEYCNINDMSGNVYEWSTETYVDSIFPCVLRGGCYDTNDENVRNYTSRRGTESTTNTFSSYSFRPLLYVAL